MLYSAAIVRTVISFKDSKYEIWVRSLPQVIEGTGNNPVKNNISFKTHNVLFQSLNEMVLCLIVHYIIANSSVSEINPPSNALTNKIEYPMF